jgi:hypothetical protein
MTTTEKFNTIYESFINGQRTQAREQFKKLKKADRKECIKYIDTLSTDKDCKNFLFDIL